MAICSSYYYLLYLFCSAAKTPSYPNVLSPLYWT